MTVPSVSELAPPTRLLLGPGPSLVHPRVLRAMSTPLLGHLDPKFLEIMNEVQAQLRAVFRTGNPFTIAVSGTGSAGMEMALVNLLEPGDTAVVVVAGVFGTRMADIVGRTGAKLVKIEVPWGQVCPPARIEEALKKEGKVKLVALVHAETSTGAQAPMEGLGRICHAHGALLVVDTVTSLGGIPVEVDGWEADAVYSGTQKCLSCPPGLAPLTFSGRALDALKARKTRVQSWYLDASMIADYWQEGKRAYHHTAPISMVYALREALRIVLEEGLEARFARHRRHSAALMAGVAALGCAPQAQEGHRLTSLNCVTVPAGVDEGAVRKFLLAEHSIEIGGGLGPLAGKVWRIGLMGESARQEHVLAVLAALEQALAKQGKGPKPGAALSAALEVYARG
ncbi:MAG TPA: alanine--glyoxylate aminotransferase family protein [Anaeromyxobacteraceae bacterium]|nr:alanine--glyoxylate aminotransferase family protein [Anaeromyxobacteraceae bacterium]